MRGAREVGVEAERLQHVGRFLAAGRTGGAGRHADVADAEEQRLAHDVREADVQVVREPVRHRAVDVKVGHTRRAGPRAGDRAARRRGSPRPSTSAAAISAALPKPTMPGTFSVPERRPRSWPPPSMSGSRSILRIRLSHEQRAHAFRPVNLVSRQRGHVDARLHDAERDLADRLHGVGVHQHAATCAQSPQSL